MWHDLTLPPGYDWLSGAMKREYDRLGKAASSIAALRAKADRLFETHNTAWQSDRAADGSRAIQAMIDALEVELRYRNDWIVFSIACDQHFAQERQEARTALEKIESTERVRLSIPADQIIPNTALALLPQWREARERFAAVENVDCCDVRLVEESHLARAESELDKFRGMLAAEKKRVAAVLEARKRGKLDATRQAESLDTRNQVHHDRQQRAAALLASGR